MVGAPRARQRAGARGRADPRPAPPHASPQPEVGRKLLGSCFRYIPRGLVTQFMDSMNSEAGLTTVDGAFHYCDPKVGLND